MSIPSRDVTVEKYGVRLRSNVHRSADRSIRHGELTRLLGHKPRNPRPDNEVMWAWVLRCAKRAGACPVDDPAWHYDPGFEGPHATQTATVRCLVPKDDAERTVFERIRLPASTHVLRYFHPADIPPLRAVWDD